MGLPEEGESRVYEMNTENKENGVAEVQAPVEVIPVQPTNALLSNALVDAEEETFSPPERTEPAAKRAKEEVRATPELLEYAKAAAADKRRVRAKSSKKSSKKKAKPARNKNRTTCSVLKTQAKSLQARARKNRTSASEELRKILARAL